MQHTNNPRGQDGLDSELDTIGVTLDKVVMCGKCRVPMVSQDKKHFICPKCNAKYEQQ